MMKILAYYFFIALLSSTSGQTSPDISLSAVYVNKSEPVIITCTVPGAISGTVVILKDGTTVFRCPSLLSCINLDNVDAYRAVQNKSAGTTTMTISASNVARDTGNWTCQYGLTSISRGVFLTVGTPHLMSPEIGFLLCFNPMETCH